MRKKLFLLLLLCSVSPWLQGQWCATSAGSERLNAIPQAKNQLEQIRIPVVFYIVDDNPNPKIQIDYSPADLQFQLNWLNQEFQAVQDFNPQQSIQFCLARATNGQPLPLPAATDINYVEQVMETGPQGDQGLGIFYINRDGSPQIPFNDAYIHNMTGLDHTKFLVIVIAASAQHGSFASYSTDIHGWNRFSSPYQHVVLLHQHLHTRQGRLNDGDVLIHEVGHYLGLAHVFQNLCSHPGDKVSDTPPYSTSNMNDSCEFEVKDACPSFNGAYPPLRSNHMDYKGDVCRQSFSPQQCARMVAVCNHNLSALIDPQNLHSAGIACQFDFSELPRKTVYAPGMVRKHSSAANQPSLAVYPNPVKSVLHIESGKPLQSLELALSDYSGRILIQRSYTAPSKDLSLNIADLSPGSYLLHLWVDGVLEQQVIIKQ